MADFEMLWNCGSCGTAGLLGVTHRHCPNCGCPQNPKSRYFPEPGQEVATKNHIFVGRDRVCKACDTAGSANIKYCGSCGCPTDGNQEVELVKDGSSSLQKPQPSLADQSFYQTRQGKEQRRRPVAGGRSLNKKVGIGVGAAILLAISSVFITFGKEVIVTEHSWKRSVAVEEFREVGENSECSSVPSGGRVTRRYADQRSREVPNGQDCRQSCSNVRSDNGDGSFSSSNQCRTICTNKYRTEYYTVNMCNYNIGRWKITRTERTSGHLVPNPHWPKISLATSKSQFGMERLGKKTELYELALKATADKKPEIIKCEIADLDSWKKFKPKQIINIRQNIYGSVTCPKPDQELAH